MAQNNPTFTIEDGILRGNEKTYEKVYPSLGKFVLDTLKTNSNSVGQIEAATGKSQTKSEMVDRSIRCALWMKSVGILAGDNVAICSHNQLDVQNAWYGTLYLGAAVTPLEDVLSAKDLGRLLDLMKPKLAFVSEEIAERIAAAARGVRPDFKIIVFGRVPGFIEFERAIAEAGAEEVEKFVCTEIQSLEEIALILCSSGTTGFPKGVSLSHGALLRQVHAYEKFAATGYQCAMFTTNAWISGALSLFLYLVSNIPRIVFPSFEENSACALIEKYKPTVIFLSSNMIIRLLKSGVLDKYDLSSLRQVAYGGGVLGIESRRAFSKYVPNALLIAAYGMTEIGASFAVQRPDSKPGSCGHLVENAQLKVIDPDTGKKLGPNQRGELLLKNAFMMSSYYNDPRATAEAIDEEGWFHSGDLGYYDQDGEIFVLERLKELIKYRGYHVSPSEIETVILSHPGVKEAAVVGIPHSIDGEHPLAFVVRQTNFIDPDKQVTEKEIADLVAAELSDHKRLRGGIMFVDQIPKTSSYKNRRGKLHDLAMSIAGDRQYDSHSDNERSISNSSKQTDI